MNYKDLEKLKTRKFYFSKWKNDYIVTPYVFLRYTNTYDFHIYFGILKYEFSLGVMTKIRLKKYN